jgi:hypothetical protein
MAHEIRCIDKDGRKHLGTKADGSEPNDLLGVAECP